MAIATANFLKAFLPSGRDACTLVKVELTDPSALTLQLSSREVVTPGSPPQFWQAALTDIGDVLEDGAHGAFDPNLATFDFTLGPRPLRGQSVADSALKLLASHYWHGAVVTAYYWELGIASFDSDKLQIFKGKVIELETESDRAKVYCQQRDSWIKRLPAVEVTREKFPRAPEKSIGKPAGATCYGDLRGIPAIAPANPYDSFNQGLNSTLGIRRPGVRGVVVSIGQGGSGKKGRVLFAHHACKQFNSDVDGSTPGLEVSGKLCEVDPNGADVINGATGTGFDFRDITSSGVEPFDIFVPVPPPDSVEAPSNNAENARAAVDGFNMTSYAKLDYDAGQREAKFMLPDVVPAGKLNDVKIVVGYSASGMSGSSPPDVVAEFVGVAASSATIILNNSSTPLAEGDSVPIDTGGGSPLRIWPTDFWSFGSQGCHIRVYFTGTATGAKARIYYCGLSLKVRPSWPVVTPERIVPGYVNDTRMVQTIGGSRRHHYRRREPRLDIRIPAVERVDTTEFVATLQGYADDGSGTYTGTASALIERPPDILRHLLATHCGESLFETGVGEPGSLVDLRSELTTWRKTDMRSAFAIDAFRSSSEVVRDLAQDQLVWFFISCFTDKWCGVPWKADRAVDFPRRLTRYDLLDPAGPEVIFHRDDVLNDIRVGYGYDAWARRTAHETFVSDSHSSAGHQFRQIRDESLTVVASESDRFDFHDGTTNRTVNLTPGSYTPMALAAHLRDQINLATLGPVQVAWGHKVVAAQNDRIDFNDGSNKTATVAPGDYTNPADLATAVATALNAVSTNWTCTYSSTTRKFTIDRTSGTKNLRWNSGTNVGLGIHLTLGYRIADVTAGSAGDFATEAQRFVIGLDTTLKVLFQSGSNGIDAATPRTCGALFGFDMARDYEEGTIYALAHSPKSGREQDCATSVARYGKRPEQVIELATVNDTDTAREHRNRILDLWKRPPVEIRFASERTPDLQRGMVFDYDASLDEVKPFPVPGTDGSWLGKKFVAVRVARKSLPTPNQSVVAFWLPGA